MIKINTMKVELYLRYSSAFGEQISVQGALIEGHEAPIMLEYDSADYWKTTLDTQRSLAYRYTIHAGETSKTEGADHRIELPETKKTIAIFDQWLDPSAIENAFLTQPFQDILLTPGGQPLGQPLGRQQTYTFRVHCPLLEPNEVLGIIGSCKTLGNWNEDSVVGLYRQGDSWEAGFSNADLLGAAYKYVVLDAQTKAVVRYETGDNRAVVASETADIQYFNDGFFRQERHWRGAGVSIPVFSLRTDQSFGVGEFTDLPPFGKWASSVGMKILQLLPVNDTMAKMNWIDSYPYKAVSAFALHPLYINVEQIAGKKHHALLKNYDIERKRLNELSVVDYEAVLTLKMGYLRELYAVLQPAFAKSAAYKTFFTENEEWLRPYAAFCYLRDKNNTAVFGDWAEHSVYDETSIKALTAPKSAAYHEIAFHYFVQFHLDQQLKTAVQELHADGLVVKGDIPIGIGRDGADAWVAPQLYHMGQQAGAPPDDFAVAGQNWGFPTYNWETMQADGYAWWAKRFGQMSRYFDAFRIDHILGFFRIWSIPWSATQGIMGRFVPAIPVWQGEFMRNGIPFDYDRYCKPFITDHILWETFGYDANWIARKYLDRRYDERWQFKPAFSNQRKVKEWFETNADPSSLKEQQNLRDALLQLHANVILIPDSDTPGSAFHFRFFIHKTSSFQHLPKGTQERLQALSNDYFHERQEELFRKEGLEKLPALQRVTNMLICGEDLGVVPKAVPIVMKELGMLSLEIQRMPKDPRTRFFDPADGPYLSVVTPATHDMSTVRGWWEEDPQVTQSFFNQQLGQQGAAPQFCEPWINRAIVAQHLHSPAMWSIFQLQDLLGMDADLRRENPQDERINQPANEQHYWQYRMHLTVEHLAKAETFNATLREMISYANR